MKPFIGTVGTAKAEVRLGVDTLLLFLVIGLLTFDNVGVGWEGLEGDGADVFNGYNFKRSKKYQVTMVCFRISFFQNIYL